MARSRLLDFQVDKRDTDRVARKLRAASGKPLFTRMQRANLTAGDLVKRRIAAAAPRRTGNLRRSTKARLARRRYVRGSTTTVLVGPMPPRGAHRHLVIRGHRIVTPGGRYLGRRTRANAYVDRAAAGFGRKAADLVRKEWRAALR